MSFHDAVPSILLSIANFFSPFHIHFHGSFYFQVYFFSHPTNCHYFFPYFYLQTTTKRLPSRTLVPLRFGHTHTYTQVLTQKFERTKFRQSRNLLHLLLHCRRGGRETKGERERRGKEGSLFFLLLPLVPLVCLAQFFLLFPFFSPVLSLFLLFASLQERREKGRGGEGERRLLFLFKFSFPFFLHF